MLGEAMKKSRTCSGCPYWKGVDENLYGTCINRQSPVCGARTMLSHTCAVPESETEKDAASWAVRELKAKIRQMMDEIETRVKGRAVPEWDIGDVIEYNTLARVLGILTGMEKGG